MEFYYILGQTDMKRYTAHAFQQEKKIKHILLRHIWNIMQGKSYLSPQTSLN